MERSEKLNGLEVSPVQVPKFQAYLRQALVFEHQRRRLARSRRTWMCTAMAALALVGFGLVWPGPVVRAHYILFPTRAWISNQGKTLPEQGRPLEQTISRESLLARTVAASLEQDRLLATELGGHSLRPGMVLPERALVISRFPLSGGREIQIYTSLLPEGDDVKSSVLLTSEGGAW